MSFSSRTHAWSIILELASLGFNDVGRKIGALDDERRCRRDVPLFAKRFDGLLDVAPVRLERGLALQQTGAGAAPDLLQIGDVDCRHHKILTVPSLYYRYPGRRDFHPHLDVVSPHGPGFRPMGWSCGDVALCVLLELRSPAARGIPPIRTE